jgi:hypothetical protein
VTRRHRLLALLAVFTGLAVACGSSNGGGYQPPGLNGADGGSDGSIGPGGGT